MTALKLRKKLMAGVLCAAMLFQNMPMSAYAAEDVQTAETDEEIQTESAELESSETQTEEPETADILESTEQETESETADSTESAETESSETEPEETQTQTETETDAEESDVQETGTEEETDTGVDMESLFPDEVFRSQVLTALEKEDNDTVTEDELAALTQLDCSRDSYDDDAIKSIEGMNYLTGLVSIDLSYNEISDVRDVVDWSLLTELKSINLDGNEISAIPNFYQNSKMEELSIKENLLTESLLKSLVDSNVPSGSGIALSDDTLFSQRTDGFKTSMESTFYIYWDNTLGKDTVPVIIMIGGYKSGLEYDIAFTLDGTDASNDFEHKAIDGKTYENIYWIADSGLEAGDHTLAIKLEQDGQVLGETVKTFTVEEQDSYLAADSYSFSTNSVNNVVGLYYTYNPSNTVDYVTLTDDSGKEYDYSNVSFTTAVETKDYRYRDIEGNAGLYVTDLYMYYTSFAMKSVIYEVPTGIYDFNIYLKDGTLYTFADAVSVKSSVSNLWTYSITSDVLYYNDETRNTATVTVTDNDETPKFAIDDTAVATIEVSTDDEDKAVVTAVAEGTATITITVGSAKMTADIEVRSRVYTSSLEISPNELTIEGYKKTTSVEVTVLPHEDGNDALEIREEFTAGSSDESVFTVGSITETDTGINIAITSVSAGEATLMVVGNDSGVYASCKVTVKEGSFSDTEKETLRKKVGTIYCLTNVDGTRLGDMELPNGWEWVSPDMELSVLSDAPATVQRYSAKYSQDGYVSFTTPIPVAVTQITGISLSGPEQITAGHEGEYSVSIAYDGYYVESNDAFVEKINGAISVEWSISSALTVSETTDRSITVTAADVDVVTNGDVTVSVTVGDEVYADEYYMLVVTEHITQIQITPATASQYPVSYVYDYDTYGDVVYVDEANVTDQSYRIKFKVAASTEDNEVDVTKGTFIWTINDSELGKIQEAADGTIHLYIYGSGTIVLRATADDIGANYAEIVVEVRDCSPILEADTIVVNKYATQGAKLPIYSVEGNEITGISVENSNFNAVKSSGEWYVTINDKNLYTDNTTVATQLTVKTQRGGSGNALTYDVNLVVDVSKPAVKLTQTVSPNLFYADTTAQYSVSTDYDITNITQSNARETGFNLSSWDSGTGTLTFTADGLSSSTLSEFKNKKSDYCTVSLLIEYDGYESQTQTIQVSSKNKKPSYKIQEIAVASTGAEITTYMIDTSTKKETALDETASVSSLTDGVTAQRNDKGRILLTYSGEKSKSYKLSVSDSNWTQSLTLSGKISVVKNLTTLLDAKKITLNMAHNIDDNGSVAVGVSIKNSTIDVEALTYTAANTKTQALLDSGYLKAEVSQAGNTLYLGLAGDKPAGVKAGSYKFNVSASISGIEIKAASLTVTLADASKLPKVTLSGKGSINLINRSATSVIYTPKLSNMTANLSNVETTGDNAGIFTAELNDDGKIEVTAVEGAVMSTASYTLRMLLSYDNNTTVSASVKVKPVNKTPKLAAGKTSGTIYKAADNSLSWKIYNRGGFGEISDISLADTDANKYFELTWSDGNNLTLELADATRRTLAAGKYTVTYQVKFTDMAYNAKPVTMKMTVTVK